MPAEGARGGVMIFQVLPSETLSPLARVRTGTVPTDQEYNEKGVARRGIARGPQNSLIFHTSDIPGITDSYFTT